MKLKHIIPILVLLFGSVAILAQQGESINDLVKLGQVNYERGNQKTAYDFFKKAMKVDPNNPGAMNWFWKMKSEHDVKNLSDKTMPVTSLAMLEQEAKAADEKAALEKAQAAEEKARAEAAKAESVKKEQELQTRKEEKERVVIVEKIREVPRIVRTGNPEMERALMEKISGLNQQVVSLRSELEKKSERDTAPLRESESGRERRAWLSNGNYLPVILFFLSLLLFLFVVAGIIWSRRRNRRIPAPPPVTNAVSAPATAQTVPEFDNRAMVLELARKFMNSPDKDLSVVAPLLSHLIKSDGRAHQEEMLKTLPYLDGKIVGAHGDAGVNSSLEVFANSFLFLMEKKLKRGNEALKVKTLCSEIGLRLGLSQDEIQELRLAALLRDTGFLVVPQNLLLKKGPLTSREEHEVRKHVVYSAKIAQFMSLPERVINVIRYHQERHDGSGYPFGAAGEEIPFMARIIAPCDSYVSMTSLRPYRRSLTSEQALKKLRVEAKLFDTKVFSIFEEVVRSRQFLKENTLDSEIA